MRPHLTMEQRQLARRLSAKGLSLREIGCQVGCSHEVVRTVVRRDSKRPVRSQAWRPGPGRLSLADREEISLGLRGGDSFTAIAARLGKAVSTVSREVAANGELDQRGGDAVKTRGFDVAGSAADAYSSPWRDTRSGTNPAPNSDGRSRRRKTASFAPDVVHRCAVGGGFGAGKLAFGLAKRILRTGFSTPSNLKTRRRASRPAGATARSTSAKRSASPAAVCSSLANGRARR